MVPPFLRRASIATLVVGLILSSGLLLIPEPTMAVLDAPLERWFDLCRYVTPEEWQTFGNAPLAMLWVFSGVAALSIVTGVVISACAQSKSGGASSTPGAESSRPA